MWGAFPIIVLKHWKSSFWICVFSKFPSIMQHSHKSHKWKTFFFFFLNEKHIFNTCCIDVLLLFSSIEFHEFNGTWTWINEIWVPFNIFEFNSFNKLNFNWISIQNSTLKLCAMWFNIFILNFYKINLFYFLHFIIPSSVV
jgi:hypothetical protein